MVRFGVFAADCSRLHPRPRPSRPGSVACHAYCGRPRTTIGRTAVRLLPTYRQVLQAVVGKKKSSEGIVPEGRDDDLAIYLGDNEQGGWKNPGVTAKRANHLLESGIASVVGEKVSGGAPR